MIKKTLLRFQEPTHDLAKGMQLRDAALAQVSENAGVWWVKALDCLEEIHDILPDEPFTCEAIRTRVEGIVGPPPHFNAWGALVAAAIKKGWIIPVSGTQHSTRISSKASLRQLYVMNVVDSSV